MAPSAALAAATSASDLTAEAGTSAAGVSVNDRFFGKTDDGFITEDLLVSLAEHLPTGVTELGLHPATETWSGVHSPPGHWRQADELAALTSPRVREAIERRAITLIRWADLA